MLPDVAVLAAVHSLGRVIVGLAVGQLLALAPFPAVAAGFVFVGVGVFGRAGRGRRPPVAASVVAFAASNIAHERMYRVERCRNARQEKHSDRKPLECAVVRLSLSHVLRVARNI